MVKYEKVPKVNDAYFVLLFFTLQQTAVFCQEVWMISRDVKYIANF